MKENFSNKSTFSNFSSFDDESKSVHSETEIILEKTDKTIYSTRENKQEEAIQFTAVNIKTQEEPEFSCLNFIAKRMNEENKHELYMASHISEVMKDVNSAITFSGTQNILANSEPNMYSGMSNEDLLKVIRAKTSESEVEDILAISDTHSQWLGVLQALHVNLTNSQLPVDKDGNICLKLELDREDHRELMVELSTIKLPNIHTLEIINFYDGDNELEEFLSNSIVSVNNLILGSDSFWVDSHDYIPLILAIPSINNLYIKGFMIDSEDSEQLFGKSNAKKLMLESWNIAIDEYFWMPDADCSEDNFGQAQSLLKSIWFINDEMDLESMKRFIKAIKDSHLSNILKNISVTDCSLSQDTVNSLTSV